mmetsp:Transcript_27048/g.89823  ORF Transcript_27048/g.89823 Transcript_27048/m.89823 type:complete len:216 (+) Transcript_27048:595-1242(+)
MGAGFWRCWRRLCHSPRQLHRPWFWCLQDMAHLPSAAVRVRHTGGYACDELVGDPGTAFARTAYGCAGKRLFAVFVSHVSDHRLQFTQCRAWCCSFGRQQLTVAIADADFVWLGRLRQCRRGARGRGRRAGPAGPGSRGARVRRAVVCGGGAGLHGGLRVLRSADLRVLHLAQSSRHLCRGVSSLAVGCPRSVRRCIHVGWCLRRSKLLSRDAGC